MESKSQGATQQPLDIAGREKARSQSTYRRDSSICSVIPESPWLEESWDKTSDTYQALMTLYSGYFDKIHRVEGEEQALVDLVICQLSCFLALDVLIDQKLLLLLLNSYALTKERYLQRHEFIRLMFFLSYASKELLEEAVFDIVSDGNTRVTVSQLVQLHTYRLQRRMSSHVLNLIGECDRSGRGLLDVYDFRLLIVELSKLEKRQSSQTLPPVDEERAKLEEALVEAQDLQHWSWAIGEPEKRVSSQLGNLSECRSLLEQHPIVAEAVSKLAWEYPQLLTARHIRQAVHHFCERTMTGVSMISSSLREAIDQNDTQEHNFHDETDK